MMSTEWVAAQMGAGIYAEPLERACIWGGMVTAREKAHFLGQVAHESGGFTATTESMDYAANRLVAVFGAHRFPPERATQYGRTSTHPADQQAIANLVYGGDWGRRNLGNTAPGDGWRFRGHGLTQLTGRDNFRRASLALFGDDRLVDHPALVLAPRTSALVAAWYWVDKGLGPWARRDDVLAVSRGVNLGNPMSTGTPNGMADRRHQTYRALALFEAL